MSLYKPKGTQFWWVNLSHAGERVRRSTGATDRAEAQRVHNEIQTELWRAKPVTGKKTWGEAVLAWCRVRPRSESELLSLRKFAERFRDRPLAEVTADDVDKALSFCESAGTYTRYRTMIAAVLKLAVTNGWLDRAPVLHKREGASPSAGPGSRLSSGTRSIESCPRTRSLLRSLPCSQGCARPTCSG